MAKFFLSIYNNIKYHIIVICIMAHKNVYVNSFKSIDT